MRRYPRGAVGAALGALLLVSAACREHAEWKPIPDQYKPPAPVWVDLPDPFVRMNRIGVERFFVSDIGGLEAGTWRWTGVNPKIRVQLAELTGWKLRFDFNVPDATFKTTGPFTLTYTVNDTAVGQQRITAIGDQKFETPVAPELLKLGENIVGMRTSKPFVLPGAGTKLGVILLAAGLSDE